MLDEDLGAAKVAELQDARRWIEEEVLGLDVSVTDALRVDVGEGAEELVDVQLDLEGRHDRLDLIEVARGAVHRLGDEFEDQVEVDFVLLGVLIELALFVNREECHSAHAFTVAVVKGLELDNVWVAHDAHNLEFSILA
jgi:hypothetical protein